MLVAKDCLKVQIMFDFCLVAVTQVAIYSNESCFVVTFFSAVLINNV